MATTSRVTVPASPSLLAAETPAESAALNRLDALVTAGRWQSDEATACLVALVAGQADLIRYGLGMDSGTVGLWASHFAGPRPGPVDKPTGRAGQIARAWRIRTMLAHALAGDTLDPVARQVLAAMAREVDSWGVLLTRDHGRQIAHPLDSWAAQRVLDHTPDLWHLLAFVAIPTVLVLRWLESLCALAADHGPAWERFSAHAFRADDVSPADLSTRGRVCLLLAAPAAPPRPAGAHA